MCLNNCDQSNVAISFVREKTISAFPKSNPW